MEISYTLGSIQKYDLKMGKNNKKVGVGNIPNWSIAILVIFICIALFRSFIANDVPLYAKSENKIYFPVWQKIKNNLGYQNTLNEYNLVKEQGDLYKIMPIIPYHASTIDKNNIHYQSPFKSQNVRSWKYRHHLGTDQIGRDIFAGIIHGTFTALKVAFLSSLIALIIGLTLGLIAGFFQDNGLKLNLVEIGFWLVIILSALYLLIYQFGFQLKNGNTTLWMYAILSIELAIFISKKIDRNFLSKLKLKKYAIPLDLLIMRIVEVYKSIPLILLIFVVLAIFQKPSLIHVIWVIGLTRWVGITRYVRAEVLHIRNQNYITAAIASGIPERKILINHILINAMSPIMVILAFSMSSAILLEATLSFLGIGIPSGTISWGSIIQSARHTPSAWWVTIFPGLAIFLLVLTFNRIAEAFNARKR